jgi:hypothetical protein
MNCEKAVYSEFLCYAHFQRSLLDRAKQIYFHLGDRPSLADCMKLGVKRPKSLMGVFSPPERDGMLIRAKRTGEYREPRRGEYYLSGAQPRAYRALNDLSSKYHIMELVLLERKTHVEIKEVLLDIHKQLINIEPQV